MYRSILIDSDVISHFINGGEINLLPKIFPNNKMYLLDKVYGELSRFKGKEFIDKILISSALTILPFPEDQPEIIKEYTHIKKMLFKGDGESACLAVARFKDNILASSNLKDISQYCKLHSIDYLTTMDFLCVAYQRHLLTSTECDEFISKVIRRGSKLPVHNIALYKCRTVDFTER